MSTFGLLTSNSKTPVRSTFQAIFNDYLAGKISLDKLSDHIAASKEDVLRKMRAYLAKEYNFNMKEIKKEKIKQQTKISKIIYLFS